MMGGGGRRLVRPFKQMFSHIVNEKVWDCSAVRGGFASCRWVSTLRESRRGVVAVGMSGGVDSSVAALLLQRQGYEVFGVYMRNWDSRDEAGGGHCTADQDYEDAQRVCRHLGMVLHHLDCQKQYWTQVFETFTQKFAMGLTPNPDLACNQHIKFDALLENALQMGADKLATGHYARLWRPQSGGPVQLLRGIDENKDQSYFLASVVRSLHCGWPEWGSGRGTPHITMAFALRGSCASCWFGRSLLGIDAWRASRPNSVRLAAVPVLFLKKLGVAPNLQWPVLSHSLGSKIVEPPAHVRKHAVASFAAIVPLETANGLPSRIYSRRELQHGQQCRRFAVVCGGGAQDASAITLFKSPRPIYPSLSVLPSSHCQRCIGQVGFSSHSLVWQRSSPSANVSGEAQIMEQLSEEYFADSSQWWDNRVDKMSPKAPDFKHKRTRKALWVSGWYTPTWVKAKTKSEIQCRSQSHSGYGTRDSQDSAQGHRLFKGNTGKEHSIPTHARELGQIAQGGGGSMTSGRTTREAVGVLKNHLQQGIAIDSLMYVEVLKQCGKQKDVGAVKEVHNCIVQSGMEQHTYVANNLMSVYIRCGRLQDARLVFEGLVRKKAASWNIMIGGYAQHSPAEDVMKLFNRMLEEGGQPDAITCLSILKACASPSALKWGREVHAYIRHGGLESDVRVGTALLKMYAKCGCIEEARQTFDNLTSRDVFSWNVMIGSYAESGGGEEAYGLFVQMDREGFTADAITYVSTLNAIATPGASEWVKEVDSHVLKAGLESDLRVGNALVHAYAKSGSIEEARRVFDGMNERDVVTWNTMIGGYGESSRGMEAYNLYMQMKRAGYRRDAISYMSILNGCASAGALEWVKEVHRDAREAGLESDLRVNSALVHIYAKSGSIDDARLIFDRMEERDVVTWTAMIGGLAQHGCGYEALEVFRRMNAERVKPDEFVFVAILSACSHAGLVDEGRRIFRAMSAVYGIQPTVMHCACVVDLLGRAGHLEEAKLFIDNMPVKPDKATWGALLGACRNHGNVELGELAAEELLKLDPNQGSTYVALSNIYAAAGMWAEVSLVRTTMQDRGIRKLPGRSWIEVDNTIHDFVVGDTSHPESKEIYVELDRLSERIKAAGYVPDTRLVLRNIDEADKELALCSHSEKLAIAYGLMRTPVGEAIRVYKNLRICSDCHTATKFISKVTGRAIVARDANRFHHFKDGVCSCDDYW